MIKPPTCPANTGHVVFIPEGMLYADFIKCLTTGSWVLRGHTYRFLSPALQNSGYFTFDGVSDSQLNFEVTFENGQMYLYLNVDRETMPEERYRILANYCIDKIAMVHEMRKADQSGYELPSMVFFEKQVESKEKSLPYQLAARLHKIWRATTGSVFKEVDFYTSR